MLTSPFGHVIEEVRRENLAHGRVPARRPALEESAPASPPSPVRAPRPGVRVPELRFETRPVSDPPRAGRTRRAALLPLSAAAHAVFLMALIVVPLIGPEALPPPAVAGRAFFVSPASPAPPPPPPPPAAAAPAPARPSRTLPSPASTPALVAPIETPLQVKPEEGLTLGAAGALPEGVAEGGAAGGVPGGVSGGIVGGVVGGLPDAPPPPRPVRVGTVVKAPRKLRHVEATYPRPAHQARVEGLVVLECTIDATGRVADVKVLRGVAALDQAAIDAVKQWIYTPTLLNGVPVPVIMTVTVNFKLS